MGETWHDMGGRGDLKATVEDGKRASFVVTTLKYGHALLDDVAVFSHALCAYSIPAKALQKE